MNKTPLAWPNLGFTIRHLAFSLGFRGLKGHLYFKPPGQCSSECGSKLGDVRRPLGNQGLCQPDVLPIRCALRTRYVRLLSGFVSTSGGLAGFVLPLSRCLVTGILSLFGSSWENEYPSLTVRACDGLSWDTPAGFKLLRAVPAVMWQMGIC